MVAKRHDLISTRAQMTVLAPQAQYTDRAVQQFTFQWWHTDTMKSVHTPVPLRWHNSPRSGACTGFETTSKFPQLKLLRRRSVIMCLPSRRIQKIVGIPQVQFFDVVVDAPVVTQ